MLASAVAGLVAASGAISAFTISTLAGADAVGQLANSTDVSVEAIQELGFVASISGSSIQAMESTIENLSKTIGDAAQKGSEDFSRLGISVRDANGHVKTADVILEEVRQRFGALNLTLAEQRSFAEALGIDSSLLQLLNRTSKEMFTLRKRARELGIVNEEQQQSIIEFNDSLTILRFGLDAVQKQIAIGLSPTIKLMAEDFTDFLIANKDLVINGLAKTGEGIMVLLDALDRLKFVIGVMIGLFVALKIATVGWGAVMGVIFSPVVLITAGIAALLLIVDDLIVAFSGGKSVIRDFFSEFFDVDITPFLKNFVAGFLNGLDLIGQGLKLLFDIFLKPWIDALSFIGGAVGRIFGAGGQLPQGITPGGQTVNQPTTIDNSVTQENTFDIRGENPQAISQAVGESLQRQLDDANNQLNRGGR